MDRVKLITTVFFRSLRRSPQGKCSQKDGRERRKLAEAELVQIEDKLKQTLLAHR